MCYNSAVIYLDCRSWVKPTIQQAVSLLNPWQGKKKSHHGQLGLISFRLLPLDWQLQFCATQQGNVLWRVKVLPWLSAADHSEDRGNLGNILKCKVQVGHCYEHFHFIRAAATIDDLEDVRFWDNFSIPVFIEVLYFKIKCWDTELYLRVLKKSCQKKQLAQYPLQIHGKVHKKTQLWLISLFNIGFP